MNDDQKFLHDIASPLATLTMLTEGVLETLTADTKTDARVLTQVQKVMKMAIKLADIVNSRRTELAAQESQENAT